VAGLQAGEVVRRTFQLPLSALSGSGDRLVIFVETEAGSERAVAQASAIVL
jgi:hypothetical protein